MLSQEVIAENEGSHCLDHRHGAGQDTGIVATSCREFGRLAGGGHGLLGLGYGGRRLESYTEENMFAIADASLNASRAVGESLNPPLFYYKGIVMFTSN